ncbi:MAG: signal peptidase II [Parcubacteria group bacterium]
MKKLSASAYLIAAVTILLDQISKYWILNVFHLPAKGSVAVAGPFNLSMVWNRGVSFGLLRAEVDLARWGLVIFSLVVATMLAVWARKITRPLLTLAVGLIMGGAVGNAIDRARFGAVADFLDFHQLYFPWVFNVADSAITVGVVLLLLDSVLSERRAKVRD